MTNSDAIEMASNEGGSLRTAFFRFATSWNQTVSCLVLFTSPEAA